MALVTSNPFPTGTVAPDFSLLNVQTNTYNDLQSLQGEKGTAIMFICNHCPFVIHVNDELVRIANEYQKKGIQFIAISSNDVENYPQDAPERMKEVAEKLQYPFPYLYDETQEVAKAYDAACTPDFYLFDENLKSVYHGRLDNATPGNENPLTGIDMRTAMDALLAGQENKATQYPSMGCSIKWK